MDKKFMNKMDDMELDKVAGGKVELPKFLRFLKKDKPPKKPTVSPWKLMRPH